MKAGIAACVGFNGGGKSMAAAHLFALPAMRAGNCVVSNARLYPQRLGLKAELYVPLVSPGQITRLGVHYDRTCVGCGVVNEHCGCGADLVQTPKLDRGTGELWSLTQNRPCVLWIDEATAAFPARQTLDLPPEVQRQIDQLRKVKVRFVITAPNYMKIDKLIRGVVQVVVNCEGGRPDRFVRDADDRKVRGPDGKWLRHEPGWEPHRQLYWDFFRAQEFEEDQVNAARLERAKPTGTMRVKVQKLDARKLLDTNEPIGLLDHLDQQGNCANCGGRKRRHECRCEPRAGRRAQHAVPASDE